MTVKYCWIQNCITHIANTLLLSFFVGKSAHLMSNPNYQLSSLLGGGEVEKQEMEMESLAQEQSEDWRVSSLVPRPTQLYFVPTLQITKKRPGNEAGELLCDFHGHGSSACRERGYQLGRVSKTSTRLSHVMNYASPSSSMAKGHMHSNSLISKMHV